MFLREFLGPVLIRLSWIWARNAFAIVRYRTNCKTCHKLLVTTKDKIREEEAHVRNRRVNDC